MEREETEQQRAQYEKKRSSWMKKNPPSPVVPFSRPNGTMLAVTPMEPLPKMLVGWNTIAEYLGVPRRTAVSFHKDYGMPVIRIARKRVFIHRDAVVEWFFRLDRMQRKFIEEAVDKSAPGINRSSARAIWLKKLREKQSAAPETIDSASFN